MRGRLLTPLMAIGFLLGWTLSLRAQQDARTIIEKAIEAQGSAERAKFKAVRIKSKGTVYQGEMEFKYTDEETYQEFDKVKSVQEMNFSGQKFGYTIGFDGQKAWIKSEAPIGLDESEINLTAYVMNELYLSRVTGLTSLLKFDSKPEYAKEADSQRCAPLIRRLGDESVP